LHKSKRCGNIQFSIDISFEGRNMLLSLHTRYWNWLSQRTQSEDSLQKLPGTSLSARVLPMNYFFETPSFPIVLQLHQSVRFALGSKLEYSLKLQVYPTPWKTILRNKITILFSNRAAPREAVCIINLLITPRRYGRQENIYIVNIPVRYGRTGER
jgi:hypothetical protein